MLKTDNTGGMKFKIGYVLYDQFMKFSKIF